MSKNTLPAKELASFAGQVALILGAGLPLYDALETLAESEKNGEFSSVYRALSERFSQSGDLSGAMKEDPAWPVYVTEMTAIGERSGKLEQVMQGLASYYEREDHIRAAVRSAVTYPLTLGIMLIAIVFIILWKVVPIFRKVLGSMGIGAGAKENALINAGSVVGWIVLAIVGVLLIAFIVIILLLKSKKREATERFLKKCFKPVRDLTEKLSASRLASVLSMLLSGGFPLGEAARMAGTVLPDEEARRKASEMTNALETGVPFGDALGKTGLFDATHLRMIRMGVTAGKEADVMEKVASIYEEDAENTIARLLSIIEPTLVALLAIVIGAVLLAVMLPMAGVLTSMLS